MSRTIFNPATREEVLMRVKRLSIDSRGRWGKLSAPQMVRHLTEACRMAFNEIPMPDRSNFFTRTIGKWIFLSNVKPPGREKGKIATFPEINIVQLAVPVNDLEKEKVDLAAILERMANTENLSNRHTLFGKMSRDDWGKLTYAHIDYHLTQFNI